MSWPDFINRTEMIQAQKQSDLLLFINPRMDQLPLPITRFDEPFFPFGKAIIAATHDLVCGYIFDLASYLALGAAGAVALERTLGYVDKQSLKILHGPFSGAGYTAMADAIAFALDGLTLTHSTDLATYLKNPPYAGFALDNAELEMGGTIDFAQGRLVAYAEGQAKLQMRLVADDFLFAYRGMDFADQIRAGLDAMR